MAFHLSVLGKVGTLEIARFRSSKSYAEFDTALGNSFHFCLPSHINSGCKQYIHGGM
jgi:hypothetical protein